VSGRVANLSGEEHLSFTGLQEACTRIVENQWTHVLEEQLETVLLEATVKSLRTGFAAGTVCRGDPVRCEFVWDMPERIGEGIKDIVSRALVKAACDAIGKPVVALMEHPLLRLGRELYLREPIGCGTALEFFRQRLLAHGVESENECPTSELDLVEWILPRAFTEHGAIIAAIVSIAPKAV
jgi:hypothetical protein